MRAKSASAPSKRARALSFTVELMRDKGVFNSASETRREVDTLARYGGDEFVIILPRANADSAFHAATGVRACFWKVYASILLVSR